MKFEENTRSIKTNVSEKSSFSIENNSAAFKILTSNLYKYPIRAIIRELSCNAIDANKEAGERENDWDLHMPSVEEPFFFIKDKGLGMSDSDIMTLYTTFFKSTKTDSNDVTGMFGLGSKTPFAYTNQFTIESTHNGIKNIYSAFFDSNGIPSISKVGSMESGEHSGVKITFHVDTYDLKEFSRSLRFCVGGWQFLPNISGLEKEELESLKLVAKAYRGNYIRDDDAVVQGRYESFDYIEMGHVLYDLSVHQLDSYIPEYIKSLNNVYEKDVGFFPHDLVFHVPIGSLSVTPSREELHYTDSTKDSLNSVITNLYFDEVYRKFSERLGNLRDLTEFFYFINEHHCFCCSDSYNVNGESILWGRILYERSIPYLTEENKKRYDEVQSVYKMVYDEFQKIDIDKLNLVSVSYKKMDWVYSFGKEKLFRHFDGIDTNKIDTILSVPKETIRFIDMDEKVDKHFIPLRPVSIYLRNRLGVLLPKIEANVFYKVPDQHFLFITSTDFNSFKKYFPNHELFQGLDGVLGTKHYTSLPRREKGKVDVFIKNGTDSKWSRNIPVDDLPSLMKSNSISKVFAIASRKVSNGYKFYLNSVKSIIGKTAVLSSTFADSYDVLQSCIGDLDRYMLVTTTPSKFAQIKDLGVAWDDPLEYILNEHIKELQKNVDDNKVISSGFFRELDREGREYFMSFDWDENNDLYKIAKDTFSISRKGRVLKKEKPVWFNSLNGVYPSSYGKYVANIKRLSEEFDRAYKDKKDFLEKTQDRLIRDCPLLKLMHLQDDLLMESRHYFYEIGGSNVENTKLFFDYIAECYGVKKKED